jgi:hypothetical protein
MNNIEKDIKIIKERNKRVEADKEWEVSMFRRITVAIMTYLIVVLFLYIIKASNYWLNALIPTTGFILSTLSLPFIKKWWIRKRLN